MPCSWDSHPPCDPNPTHPVPIPSIHVRDLQNPTYRIWSDDNYKLNYQSKSTDKKKVIADLKTDSKDTTIYLAADEDEREGELLLHGIDSST